MNGLFIPQEILELEIGSTKKLLLSEIYNKLNGSKSKVIYNKELASKLFISDKTVSGALKELESDNLIKIDTSKMVRNYGREVSLNLSIQKTSTKTRETKGCILGDDDLDRKYDKQDDFSLSKDTAWDKLPKEYKENLKIYIEKRVLELENKIIAGGGNKKTLQYEDFELQLEAKSYKYKNFAAAWRSWNGNTK